MRLAWNATRRMIGTANTIARRCRTATWPVSFLARVTSLRLLDDDERTPWPC